MKKVSEMKSINALSLTPEVNDWLATSDRPRILHIFDQACNLVNEHGELLSIVTPQVGNGPFNLVLEDDICFAECLSLDSLISTRLNYLAVGYLTIDIATADTWSPRPDWELLHGNRIEILDQLTSLPIADYQITRGFARSFQNHAGPFNHQILPIANSQFSHTLISALTNADLTSSLTAARRLAGFGAGLTPSGDDFIMGAIYAGWIIHPHTVACVLAREIANTSAPLTTSLSASWLRSAGKGEAGILWHHFFDALNSAEPVRIYEAVNKILAIGESSGAAAMAGFFSSFMCWVEHHLHNG
jgi:hypothetical protein